MRKSIFIELQLIFCFELHKIDNRYDIEFINMYIKVIYFQIFPNFAFASVL